MATRNIFELDASKPGPLARIVILGPEDKRVVWRALAMGAGWAHVHTCGRVCHQWMAPQRPSHVQCPGGKGWVAAP